MRLSLSGQFSTVKQIEHETVFIKNQQFRPNPSMGRA